MKRVNLFSGPLNTFGGLENLLIRSLTDSKEIFKPCVGSPSCSAGWPVESSLLWVLHRSSFPCSAT